MGVVKKNKKLVKKQQSKAAAATTAASSESILSSAPSKNRRLEQLSEKLLSTDTSDKTWAAATVSHLVSSYNSTSSSSNLLVELQTLTGSLLDGLLVDDMVCQLEIAGALRNLAVFGGVDCVMDMVRKDALRPILTLLNEIAQPLLAKIVRPTDSSNDLNPPFSSNHQQQQQLQDEKQTSIDLLTSLAPLAEQLLTLLYTICQSSDAALSKVTSLATAASVGSSSSSSSANLLTFLLALALQTREATISVAAGYCINVLTEDNKLVAQFLTRPGTPYLDQLFSWLSSVCASGPTLAVSTLTTQTAVLVGHVLYNLRMHIKNDGAADLMHAVFAAISHGIQKSSNCSSDGSGDVFEAVKLAVDAVLVQQSTANSNQVETLKEGVDHELKETAEEKKLNRILKQVASLQMALELAANAFSEDLPNEEEEGVDDQDEEMQEDEDENDDDEDFQADAQLGPNNGEDDVVDSSYQTSSESVNSTLLSLLPLITRIAQTATAFSIAASTPASSESSSVIADDATAAVKTVGIRALCALGNLVDRLPAGWVKSHLADVKTLWSWLFDLAMSASPSPSPPTPPAADDSGLPSSSSLVAETIDATVGVMWAVLRRIEECVNLDSIPDLSPSQLNVLLETSSNATSAPEALRVKCISMLGIFGRLQSNIAVNKSIGTTLISILASSTQGIQLPLPVLSESLNALFDIYADAAFSYDSPVFVGCGMLEMLKTLLPILRARVKGVDKRRARDVRDRADEMILNLRAFVLYKQKEVSRCGSVVGK